MRAEILAQQLSVLLEYLRHRHQNVLHHPHESIHHSLSYRTLSIISPKAIQTHFIQSRQKAHRIRRVYEELFHFEHYINPSICTKRTPLKERCKHASQHNVLLETSTGHGEGLSVLPNMMPASSSYHCYDLEQLMHVSSQICRPLTPVC